MESEAISSVKIALNLMMISSLIFVIIILVKVVKPDVYDIILSVVNVTDEEKSRQFDDYDQKWVSGSKVLRTLKVYEGTGFGIIYQTTKTKTSGDYGVNFGGIFNGAATYTNGCGDNGYQMNNFSNWKTRLNTNDTFYTKGFKTDGSGAVVRYEDKSAVRHSSTLSEYIKPDGRFYAELIKDKTGEIIGICFTQE